MTRISSAMKEKVWKAGLTVQARLATPSLSLVTDFGKGEDGIICCVGDLENSRGSSVTHNFQSIDTTTPPKSAGDPTIGDADSTTHLYDSVDINFKKFDHGVPNAFEQQQVSFALRQAGVNQMLRKWAYAWETCFTTQLVGDTQIANGKKWTFGNEIRKIESNHVIYAAGASAHTTPAGVGGDSTAVLTTDIIDDLEAMADDGSFRWPIVPAWTPIGTYYVLMVNGQGLKQLKATSGSDWRAIKKAELGTLAPGESDLHDADAFLYSKTLVLKNTFLPKALDDYVGAESGHEDNTAVASFCGAKSLIKAYGEGYSTKKPLGHTEVKLHEDYSATMPTVCGVQRLVPRDAGGTATETWGNAIVVHYNP